MSQILTVELNDKVYAALSQQAEGAGVPLSEWIAISLEQRSGLLNKQQTEAEKELARKRFRCYAGSINLGYSTGVDNEGMDADQGV
jgi:hypothetical protein